MMKILPPLAPPTSTVAPNAISSFPSAISLLLLLLLSLLTAPNPALADRGYPDDVATTDPLRLVRESAPLWLLPTGTCIPTAAVTNGIQNNGTASDLCQLLGSLTTGCPAQAPYYGSYSKSTPFPTYYLLRYCPNVNQIRILYNAYYPKDTSHPHDWEWAVVTFKQNQTAGSDWRWHREKLILQNEGAVTVSDWRDVPEAYAEGDDPHNNSGANGDHPKLYVGKFRHSVHVDPFTFILSKYKCPYNGSPIYGDWDYRQADYYFPAQEWLVDGGSLRKDWTWGEADSPPPAFSSDGKYDLCYLRVDVTS
ncbi:hypothetical protein DRE_03992 [Drechslerella stenobrocha 248]|uniref:Uncharacterized protein n=1 Tax=Drechslerella stenobrocha 248 TaxID=1043628 RepID=W7I2U8_9PEZI|nr:hypothetical protein DRE_03992 [Drechslerella stenobrocha 248]